MLLRNNIEIPYLVNVFVYQMAMPVSIKTGSEPSICGDLRIYGFLLLVLCNEARKVKTIAENILFHEF